MGRIEGRRVAPLAPAAPDPGYPVVVATADGSGAFTPYTVPLPGVEVGDLLVAYFGQESGGDPITWPAGWPEILDAPTDAANARHAIAYRIADGTEGASITVTSADAGQWYSHVLRITGHGGAARPPEVAAWANAFSTTPNPAAHTPTGGEQAILWLVSTVTNPAITAHPGGYTITDHATAHGWELAVGWRQRVAASENPGPWTLNATRNWGASTVSVRP